MEQAKAEKNPDRPSDRAERLAEKVIEREEALFREGNISLILENYNDIFSDFDPRPYEHKALSDDFLHECRKAARDKDVHEFELRILVPKEKRGLESEAKIRHRLHEHFHKHYAKEEQELRTLRKKGSIMVAAGLLCFVLAVYITTLDLSEIMLTALTFLFEPAGWFLMWEGLDQIVFTPRERMHEYQFYKKMAGVHIGFYGY